MAKAKKDSVVAGGEPGRTPLPHILQDAGIQFKGKSVLIPDPQNARDNVTSDSRTLVPQDNSGDSQNALSQATQNYGWKNENNFAPVRVTDVGAAVGIPSPVPYPIADSVQTTSQLPDMLYPTTEHEAICLDVAGAKYQVQAWSSGVWFDLFFDIGTRLRLLARTYYNRPDVVSKRTENAVRIIRELYG